MTFYKVPAEHRIRIHFVRPRFKNKIESVLLHMATSCCRIGDCDCETYNQKYTNAIRAYKGNARATDKTIANWRTETPALFAFYKEDRDHNVTRTTSMAKFLCENQDLGQFFKFFLFSFQLPGGHLKPQENLELIKKNIKFKPAQLIIKVCMEANSIYSEQGKDKDFAISAEEATYCLFDDSRLLSGKMTHRQAAEQILENRRKKVKYYDKSDRFIFSSKNEPRSLGDVTRYAGDILDYMVLASLMEKDRFGYYRLKPNEVTSINQFAKDNTFFNGYDSFYRNPNSVECSQISAIEPSWYEYVDNQLNPDMFKTNIAEYITTNATIPTIYKDQILFILNNESATKKDTGDVGEAIVEVHEKTRLENAGYPELSKRVQIVDSPSYRPGYDIDSFEGDKDQIHRYIEVKTTISQSRLEQYDFHMSPNEWSVASTQKEHYCVYRLMISAKELKLYILRNPVRLYKTDKIEAKPRDGMEVSFDADNFETTEVLVCPV